MHCVGCVIYFILSFDMVTDVVYVAHPGEHHASKEVIESVLHLIMLPHVLIMIVSYVRER